MTAGGDALERDVRAALGAVGDDQARALAARVRGYVEFYEADLRARGLLVGRAGDARLDADFLRALVEALRGETRRRRVSGVPLPDVPDDRPEG